MTEEARVPEPISVMIATRIAGALGKAAAPRVKQIVMGTEDQRAIDRAFRVASEATVEEFPDVVLDGPYLISLFNDQHLADLLIDAAFAEVEPRRDPIEERLTHLGYDPSTSPLDLVAFAVAVSGRLQTEIRAGANRSDGGLFNRLVLTKLDTLADRFREPDPPRWHLPAPPTLMIGRATTIDELTRRVTGTAHVGAAMPVIAVRGWPGVGKSSLVAAVAHHPAIRRFFTDGVLWAPLSEKPDVRAHLATWCRTVGVRTLDPADTVEAASLMLAGALRDKRALLLIDDVWQAADAVPLLVGGGCCAAIVTTRSTEVAAALTTGPADVLPLAVLDDEDGIELIRLLAPAVVRAHPAATGVLVRELEGLPLALKVAGRLLGEEHGYGLGVEALIEQLRDGARLLEAKAPADRTDLATLTTPTIAALLAKSTDRLPEPSRIQFAMLGAFAEKPAVFDLPAIKALWEVDDPRPGLRDLVRRGLLEPVNRGYFQLHALLAMHARAILAAA